MPSSKANGKVKAKPGAKTTSGKNGQTRSRRASKSTVKPAAMVHETPRSEFRLGENAVTVDECKGFVGWEEETEQTPFGSDFLFTDFNGKKIRLTKSTHNRPFTKSWALKLAEKHLRRRYKFNGQPIIIGQYDEAINGQHRCVSVVLAEQMRTSDKAGPGGTPHKDYWANVYGDGPVTMETLMVYGVPETDDVVNTIDTGKGRSLGDALYRSGPFSAYPPRVRQPLARIASLAVRLLWHRTWVDDQAFAPRRDHDEFLDFLARHGRIIEAAKFILDTYQSRWKVNNERLAAGYAAAALYLMASSSTEERRYHSDVPDPTMDDGRSEKVIDFASWDKACDFWTLLCGASPDLKAVRTVLGSVVDQVTGGPLAAKLAVLARAWSPFLAGKKITEVVVTPHLTEPDPETGHRKLDDLTNFGGIDRGEPIDEETQTLPAEREQERPEPKSKPEETFGQKWEAVKAQNPNALMIFDAKVGYSLWSHDADTAERLLGKDVITKGEAFGLARVVFPKELRGGLVDTLKGKGCKLVLVQEDPDGGYLFRDL